MQAKIPLDDRSGLLSVEAGLDHGAPLFRQVYLRIRTAILSGDLRPGDRLPSTRLLAVQLPASRATVQTAYDMLIAEGYLVAHGAKGTLVAPTVPAPPGRALPAAPPPALPNVPSIPAIPPRPFQMGQPAIDAFPRRAGRAWPSAPPAASRRPPSPSTRHRVRTPCAARSRAISVWRAGLPAPPTRSSSLAVFSACWR